MIKRSCFLHYLMNTFLQPREKLKNSGPENLEDHELVSIILSHGTLKENVFDLSKRLLSSFDREELLTEKSLASLQKSLGLGFVQTCQLMATIELGKRFFKTKSYERDIQTTDDVYQVVKNMQFLRKEYVRGLYLNSRYRIVHDEIITIGSLDANIIHPREIFRPAIEYGAFALILAHNHPSGDSTPSTADIEVSKDLVRIGNLLQIPLLDHLVVGNGTYVSLQKQRFL